MSDGSGASSSELFGTVDALGSSLKTSVGSCLCRMRPGLSVTWRERGSRFGLFYSEPTTSAPRTSETESGSSEDWQTPASHQFEKRRQVGQTERAELLLPGQVKALAAGTWPTPRSEDSEQTGSHRGDPDTLTSAARLWPTPNSHDAERGAESKATKDARGSGGVNLREACNWPTPKSRDVKGMSQRGTHKPEDALLNMVNAGLPDQASPSTNGKRRDWCTPNASLGEAGTTSRSGHRIGELLLSGQAKAESLATSGTSAPPTSWGQRSGSLNPTWVAQLMGFPDGWLDLPEEALSALSATASSRVVRK